MVISVFPVLFGEFRYHLLSVKHPEANRSGIPPLQRGAVGAQPHASRSRPPV